MSNIQPESTSSAQVSPQLHRFGRRPFLGILASVVTGLTSRASTNQAVAQSLRVETQQVSTEQATVKKSPERNLEEAGLLEFIPMYQRTKLFHERWGIVPPIFQGIQTVLSKVADGDSEILDTELYKHLSGEWGNQISKSEEDAEGIFREKQIRFGPEVNETTQNQVRNVIRNIFKKLTSLADVATPTIVYEKDVRAVCGYDAHDQPTLGCTDSKNTTHVGQQSIEEFAYTYLHESNHNLLDYFGDNTDVFQHITKLNTVDYYTGTVDIIDRFLTNVAQDSSANPAEYTYGYSNWKDRSQARNNISQYQVALALQQKSTEQTPQRNYTPLTEDPEYNLVLRHALKAMLEKQIIEGKAVRENEQLAKLLMIEMSYIYHYLHTIELGEDLRVGENINAVVQQFLDIKLEHQRLWLPFVSGGKLSGTISTNALRSVVGLNPLTTQDQAEDLENESNLAFEDFGGTSVAETGSEFCKASLISLPECSTDPDNNYFAIAISARMQPKRKPHTILFSLPTSIKISECKLENSENTVSLILPDNKRLTMNTAVITDTSSPQYGSIGMVENNILTDSEGLQFMYVTGRLLNNHQTYMVQSLIGLSSGLNEQSGKKGHNIPSLAITDIENNLFVYAAKPNTKFSKGDILQLQSKDMGGACIIITEQGPRLFTSCFPKTRKFDDVETVIAEVNQYGAVIIGKKRLRQFAVQPDLLTIDFKLNTSSQATYGAVIASIVAIQNGSMQVFPIDITV